MPQSTLNDLLPFLLKNGSAPPPPFLLFLPQGEPPSEPLRNRHSVKVPRADSPALSVQKERKPDSFSLATRIQRRFFRFRQLRFFLHKKSITSSPPSLLSLRQMDLVVTRISSPLFPSTRKCALVPPFFSALRKALPCLREVDDRSRSLDHFFIAPFFLLFFPFRGVLSVPPALGVLEQPPSIWWDATNRLEARFAPAFYPLPFFLFP